MVGILVVNIVCVYSRNRNTQKHKTAHQFGLAWNVLIFGRVVYTYIRSIRALYTHKDYTSILYYIYTRIPIRVVRIRQHTRSAHSTFEWFSGSWPKKKKDTT